MSNQNVWRDHIYFAIVERAADEYSTTTKQVLEWRNKTLIVNS